MIQMNTHKDVDRQQHTHFSLLVLMFHSSGQRELIMHCFMIESHRMCTPFSHFLLWCQVYTVLFILHIVPKAALQKLNFYSPNWALYGDLPCWITQCPFWFFLSLPLPLGMDALAHDSGTWHMLVCHPPIIMLPTIFVRMQVDSASFAGTL